MDRWNKEKNKDKKKKNIDRKRNLKQCILWGPIYLLDGDVSYNWI